MFSLLYNSFSYICPHRIKFCFTSLLDILENRRFTRSPSIENF